MDTMFQKERLQPSLLDRLLDDAPARPGKRKWVSRVGAEGKRLDESMLLPARLRPARLRLYPPASSGTRYPRCRVAHEYGQLVLGLSGDRALSPGCQVRIELRYR